MAKAVLTITQTDKEVVFAILTGGGRKGKKPENEYTLGIEVSAEDKKRILADMNKFWESEKSSKAKKPGHSFDEFFTDSKDNKGGFVFWASEVVSSDITRKVAAGKGFTLQHFADMGAGSLVDAEYRAFYYSNAFGEGLGLRLAAVKLNEFIKYSKSGGNTLEGDTLESDGVQSTESASEADEEDPLITDFKEALEDRDWEDAKEILEELEDHKDYKKLKKQLRKAKK